MIIEKENMIRRLLVVMFLFMGCILWLSAQEVKTENFSINVGENHIDYLATVVSKSDSLVLHTDSLVSRLDSMVLKKDSLALVAAMLCSRSFIVRLLYRMRGLLMASSRILWLSRR